MVNNLIARVGLLIAAGIICAMLGACGQSGALYLPDAHADDALQLNNS